MQLSSSGHAVHDGAISWPSEQRNAPAEVITSSRLARVGHWSVGRPPSRGPSSMVGRQSQAAIFTSLSMATAKFDRHHHQASRLAAAAGDKRQESDMACALDCRCQRTLVPGARAELPSRLDLAAFGNVPSQPGDVLVIDLVDVVDAERADLAPRHIAAAARSPATGPRSPTVAAFALRAWSPEAGAALAPLWAWVTRKSSSLRSLV
jgi:hypothetical protein